MVVGPGSRLFLIYLQAQTLRVHSSISRRVPVGSCIGIEWYVVFQFKFRESSADKKLQAEWGYLYSGSVQVSAVDENGDYQVDILEVGDIWYFPKGSAHTIQGMFLLT